MATAPLGVIRKKQAPARSWGTNGRKPPPTMGARLPNPRRCDKNRKMPQRQRDPKRPSAGRRAGADADGPPRLPFRPKPRPGGGTHGPVILYGWHTVKAALENPQRRIQKLFATENAARRLADHALAIEPELVRPEVIAARLPADAVHQGLLAEADPLVAPAIDDLCPA